MPADRGYDSGANQAAIEVAGAEPCTLPRANRTEPAAYDPHLYDERNGVER